MSEAPRWLRRLIAFMGAWMLLTTSAVSVVVWRNPVMRAVLCMGWGLIILWILVCGSLMFRFRNPICGRVRAVRLDWRLKFVLFATLLAMLEEAITTTMTNLAPLFGVRIGQAYITASANYLDVIALHSVSVFVSMFVGWAVILSYVSFRGYEVALLFGITGILAETLTFGLQNIGMFATWIVVYGLMIWLPAYCLPANRRGSPPRWWHYPMAVIAPFLFLLLFPLAFVIHLFFPHHPQIHFPPMRT